MIQATKKLISEMNAIKAILASVIVLLPLLGANIISFVDWSVVVYNLKDQLEMKQDKTDTMEVLLYIEDALYDDVTFAKFEIERTKGDEDMNADIRVAMIDAHFAAYNFTLLKLERIRRKIKTLDPTWKTREEIQDEKRKN